MNSSQFVFINSKDRLYQNDDSSDCTVAIQDLTPDDDDYSITVQNLSIPGSYYNINSLNNTIPLSSIVLTPGNYNTTSLLSEIYTQSNSLGFGITGSYNSTTDKFTFLGTTGFNLTASANQPYLGLSTGLHTSIGASLITDKAINLAGPTELHILCDLPIYSSNTANKNHNLLVSVYPNFTGTFTNYQLSNFGHFKMRNASQIQNVHFRLENEYGEKIDLRGLDWAMTLLITGTAE